MDTETWVQCARCQKWRSVPNNARLDAGWHCRLNVFSADRNTCEAPQEVMPDDDEPASDDDDDDDGEPTWASDREEDLFEPSHCQCGTCASMNEAHHTWSTMEEHSIPLVATVIKAINYSAIAGEALEKEKRFVYCPADPEIPHL